MFEISDGYFAVVIRIEYLQGVDEVLEAFFVLSAFLHDLLEGLQSEAASSLGVNFLLHFNDFGLSWVQIESSHKGTEFASSDLPPIAFVKQREDLFDFVGWQITSYIE